MDKKATWYLTDGTILEVTPQNGVSFTLEELKGFVTDENDNEMIEFAELPNGFTLVLNEEGKLIDLPVNEKATEIWKKEHPLNNDDLIVGNVLICHPSFLE